MKKLPKIAVALMFSGQILANFGSVVTADSNSFVNVENKLEQQNSQDETNRLESRKTSEENNLSEFASSSEENKPIESTSSSEESKLNNSKDVTSNNEATSSEYTNEIQKNPQLKEQESQAKEQVREFMSSQQPNVSSSDIEPYANYEQELFENKDGYKVVKNNTTEKFIETISDDAFQLGKKYSLYASVMIAQAILESGSGSSQLSQNPYFNLFGIKGEFNSHSVIMGTHEDLNEEIVRQDAQFKVYPSYKESLEDYAQLLTKGIDNNPAFYQGALKSHAKTYQEATKFLTGKYATDRSYNSKLNALIKTYDLEKYDKEMEKAESSPATKTAILTKNIPNSNGFILPLDSYILSSGFGFREFQGEEFHRGLDFASQSGAPIKAIKSGKVIKAETHPSWGNYVVIEHTDGTTSLYAHQQEYIVNVGDEVVQGQIIGYVGSTGNSTGSHLHLEICKDSSLIQQQLIDPSLVLP